jgi:nucleotide-binding universal stress UspA family protein
MYRRILVPVDGSAASAHSLAEAISVARLTGGRIRLLHVFVEPFEAVGIDGAMVCGADIHRLVHEGGESLLARAQEQVESQDIDVDTLLESAGGGRICDIVAQVSRTWPADLVVIGTHGRRGVGRLLLGSDAEQILRLSPCPVLLVRAAAAEA